MRLLIIMLFISVACYSQRIIVSGTGKVIVFQSQILFVDTTTQDTTVITQIGDGVQIGDGIKIGDGAYIIDVKFPKQYMKEEEFNYDLS